MVSGKLSDKCIPWYGLLTRTHLGGRASVPSPSYIKRLLLRRRYAEYEFGSHFLHHLPDLSVGGPSPGHPSRLGFVAGSPEHLRIQQRATRAQRPLTLDSDRIKLAPSVGTLLHPSRDNGRGWTTAHGDAFKGGTRRSGRDKGRQTHGAKTKSIRRAGGATSNICVWWPSGSTSSHRRIPSGLISHP